MAQDADKKAALQPPPRLTGDYANDAKTLSDWLWNFFSVAVLQSGLLDPTFQATIGTVNPDNLPDPTHTTIARGQYTANLAYALAAAAQLAAQAAANQALAARPLLTTEFTLSDANNQEIITFGEARDDNAYEVLVQAQDFSGTPNANAFIPVRVAKSAADFTITLGDAPGAGNSISFVAIVLPS